MINKYITLEDFMKRVHAELLVHLSSKVASQIGIDKGFALMPEDGSYIRYGSNPEYYEKAETLCLESGLNLSAIPAKKLAELMRTSTQLEKGKYEQCIELAKQLDERINFPRPYGRGFNLSQTSFALHLFYPGLQCMLVSLLH